MPAVRLPVEIVIAGAAARAQTTAMEAAAVASTLVLATIESAFPRGGRVVETLQLLTTLAVTPSVLDALSASTGGLPAKIVASATKNNITSVLFLIRIVDKIVFPWLAVRALLLSRHVQKAREPIYDVVIIRFYRVTVNTWCHLIWRMESRIRRRMKRGMGSGVKRMDQQASRIAEVGPATVP